MLRTSLQSGWQTILRDPGTRATLEFEVTDPKLIPQLDSDEENGHDGGDGGEAGAPQAKAASVKDEQTDDPEDLDG